MNTEDSNSISKSEERITQEATANKDGDLTQDHPEATVEHQKPNEIEEHSMEVCKLENNENQSENEFNNQKANAEHITQEATTNKDENLIQNHPEAIIEDQKPNEIEEHSMEVCKLENNENQSENEFNNQKATAEHITQEATAKKDENLIQNHPEAVIEDQKPNEIKEHSVEVCKLENNENQSENEINNQKATVEHQTQEATANKDENLIQNHPEAVIEDQKPNKIEEHSIKLCKLENNSITENQSENEFNNQQEASKGVDMTMDSSNKDRLEEVVTQVKLDDIVMDTEISSNNETTEKLATTVFGTPTKTKITSEIKISSNEITQPVSNLENSQVIKNSLGLSLLASEYASSDEDEDSTSSDDDGSTSEEESDCSSSVKSVSRNAADNLELIAAEIENVTNSQAYRNQIVEIDSDTSSDSSDIEIISQTTRNQEPIKIGDESDDDDDDNEDGNKKKKDKKRSGPLRVKGELLLEDLPPIEDLHITVPENECEELGTICSIVDQLVLVDSIPGTVLLDLDTVLFLDKGHKVLGKVFDVLGQVAKPMYCIRFNSNKQIKEKNIEIGQTVYMAPKTEHTQFIILSKLMSIRGSDASWENDIEPPENHIDYSDDEQERNARSRRRNRNGNESINGDDDTESSYQDDTESVQSFSTVSTVASRQRSRKRPYNNQRQINHHSNQQNQSGMNPQNQGYNHQSSYNYGHQYSNSGYNYQNNGNHNPYYNPVSAPPPHPYYSSGYNSWHNNFNPYNGNYQGPPPNPGIMPMGIPPSPYSNMPPPYGHVQQPFYPSASQERFHPPQPPPPK